MRCAGCQNNIAPQYFKPIDCKPYYYFCCADSKHNYQFSIDIDGIIQTEFFVYQKYNSEYEDGTGATEIYVWNTKIGWKFIGNIPGQLQTSNLKLWQETIENMMILS